LTKTSMHSTPSYSARSIRRLLQMTSCGKDFPIWLSTRRLIWKRRISKLSANLVELSPAPFHPLLTIQDTLRMFQMETKVKNISLNLAKHYHIAPQTRCLADATRYQQVIINLLGNAIKFVPGGGDKREIVCSIGLTRPLAEKEYDRLLEKAQDWNDALSFCSEVPPDFHPGASVFLHGSVTDSGAGLTAEEQSKVFKRFSQAKPKTHRDFGVGLGLWISRRLVELNQGRIVLHSRPDVGTSFRFYWEVQLVGSQEPKHAEVIAVPVIQNPAYVAKVASLPMQPSNIDRFKVLVVEDNLVNQKVLCRLLQKLNCDTVTADDGLDCLDKLQAARSKADADSAFFNLCLMDIEMPGISGLEATQRVRQMEADGQLKGRLCIVAVSANARDHYVDESFAAGMDGFLRVGHPLQCFAGY
jgi:CheY-like chemotaxis protein